MPKAYTNLVSIKLMSIQPLGTSEQDHRGSDPSKSYRSFEILKSCLPWGWLKSTPYLRRPEQKRNLRARPDGTFQADAFTAVSVN